MLPDEGCLKKEWLVLDPGQTLCDSNIYATVWGCPNTAT